MLNAKAFSSAYSNVLYFPFKQRADLPGPDPEGPRSRSKSEVQDPQVLDLLPRPQGESINTSIDYLVPR